MKTINTLLRAKGNDVFGIAPDASVYEAIQEMSDRGVGALLVMEGDRLVGIISERDYARKVILQGRSSRDTPVRDIMTGRVYFIPGERTIEEALALMTDKRIRHLPVFAGEQLIGIVTLGDLVKDIISNQQFMIEQLESYITS